MLNIRSILLGLYGENCFLVWREGETRALVIDPGDGIHAIRAALAAAGVTPGAILLTHGHFDHMLGAKALQDEYACPVYVHEADQAMIANPSLAAYDAAASSVPFAPVRADHALSFEGRSLALELCGIRFTLYHTPGHTAGSLCALAEGEGALFTGDTLFAMGYGRTDLPTGDGRAMMDSLRFLFSLGQDLAIYPGHGPASTIGEARRALW